MFSGDHQTDVNCDDDYDNDHDERDDCWTCGGEGWGVRGEDWTNDDPINDPDGEIEECPNCHGSGSADDVWYW